MTLSDMLPRSVVLVVDDEVLIAMNVAETLEDCGYRAITVHSADRALEVLAARDDVSVVITDINMPGSMDGLELSRRIAQDWPVIQIVVMSGRRYVHFSEMPASARFLMKPFSEAGLMDAAGRPCYARS